MFFSVLHPRVLARLDRVLLGRQAERVEAHRVHHALALHPRGAADDVGRRVALRDGPRAARRRWDTGTCRARRASRRPASASAARQTSGAPPNSACHLGSITAGLYFGISQAWANSSRSHWPRPNGSPALATRIAHLTPADRDSPTRATPGSSNNPRVGIFPLHTCGGASKRGGQRSEVE